MRIALTSRSASFATGQGGTDSRTFIARRRFSLSWGASAQTGLQLSLPNSATRRVCPGYSSVFRRMRLPKPDAFATALRRFV